jgi:putative FmdB family regulatory protein
MPTYSYKCTICDTAFDIQQSFTDDSLTECPECSGKLRKLYSAVGVSFNGSGFYRNDSRASAAKKSTTVKKEAKSSSDSASSSTSTSSTSSSTGGSSSSSSSSSPSSASAS